jgi:lipoyl(octanoyl) transferase
MLSIIDLGLITYQDAVTRMQAFTQGRSPTTPDEIWLCEHLPVFTLGRHADPSHILDAHNLPVIHTDRGGQVTYHGPGQLMVYCLFDLKRKKLGIKEFVCRLESAVIETLKDLSINATRRKNMPGVYVNDAKICAIGLRVKNGCTYHGLALNVNMDLSPFADINPCGYEKLTVTQIAHFLPEITLEQVSSRLIKRLSAALS